jgi:hypothetical protein
MADNEWQPIKTAPRDGTRVWLFDPDTEECVGSYASTDLPQNHPDYWEGWVYAEEILINHCATDPVPTHWMPIPKRPANDAILSLKEAATDA